MPIHLQNPRDDGEREQLAEVLARNMARGNILGRMQILKHAHGKTGALLPLAESVSGRAYFAEDPAPRQSDRSDQVGIGMSFDVGGEKNAEFMRGLTPVLKPLFDGLTALYRRDAFTLAGVADQRLLERIQAALAEVASEGGTERDFRKAVAQITSEEGAEQINAFTLDTAFNIAMQKAYSAGRLEQMRQPHMLQAFPFWKYWTVGDDRVRPGHAALHGFIARAEDPVWMKIYPPWDFNCRCSVTPILESEALKQDKNAAEDGWARVRMKPFTMLEVETSTFGTLLAG